MTVYFIWYLMTITAYMFTYSCSVSEAARFSSDVRIVRNKRRIFRLVLFSMGMLVLIVGLRSEEMGVDLSSYLPSFTRLNNYSWNHIILMDSYLNYEKGYVVFNKIVGSISDNYHFFLFICAAISLIPIGNLIYRNSKNPLLSIFVYAALPTFLTTFSALRQAIAIGITVLAFEFIKRRKIVPFCLLILLAVCFHSSAIVVLIAYPLYWWKPGKKWGTVSVIALPVIYIIRFPLFSLLSKVFKKSASVDNNGALTLFLVFTLIYIFCLFFGNRKNESTNGLMNLFWTACAVQAMGGVNSIVIRVGYYFMTYLTLLLPEVFDDMKKRMEPSQRRILLLITEMCFIAYGLYAIRHGGWAESYPYAFFWEAR